MIFFWIFVVRCVITFRRLSSRPLEVALLLRLSVRNGPAKMYPAPQRYKQSAEEVQEKEN